MTHEQTVLAAFEAAGSSTELSLVKLTADTGLSVTRCCVAISRLKAHGKVLHLRRGVYRLASEAERIVNVASTEAEPSAPKASFSDAEAIRKDERAKLIARVREAARTGQCREAREYIDGFEAGVQHVVDTILGGETRTQVRRTG